MNIWHHEFFSLQFEKKIQNVFGKNERKGIYLA
jgi:hypothetical protein